MERKLVDVAVAAKILSVSDDTIRRMLVDPDSPLQGARISKRSIRVYRESVYNVLKEMRIDKDANTAI